MEKSYFDGGLLQLIGWKILGFLVTFFTLGICYPWAVCMIYNWETKHTVVNGKRLSFNGTALQLFGNWIKWWLLTAITLGIYGLWASINVKKWVTKHTEFKEPLESVNPTASAHQPQPHRIEAPAYAAAPAQTVHLSGDSILDTPLFLVGAAILSAVGVGAFIFTVHVVPGLVVAAIGIGLLIVFYAHQRELENSQMDHQQAIEELEALRVAVGRHMMALDGMTPVEQSNACLSDLERMRQLRRELEKMAR